MATRRSSRRRVPTHKAIEFESNTESIPDTDENDHDYAQGLQKRHRACKAVNVATYTWINTTNQENAFVGTSLDMDKSNKNTPSPQEKVNFNWGDFKPASIISRSANHYLVSRQGLPMSGFAMVPIADVELLGGDQSTLGSGGCPTGAELIDAYDVSCLEFERQYAERTKDAIANLENLPAGSKLQPMALIKAMIAPGGELSSSRIPNDADVKIPILALSRAMQRLVETALEAQSIEFAKERAAWIAERQAILKGKREGEE